MNTYRVYINGRLFAYTVVRAVSSFAARREVARRYRIDVTETFARREWEGETS